MGSNQFLTLATLTINSDGPQTAVDLVSNNNPSGLNSDLTFICTGSFIGDIIIEGSPSASGNDFDVVCQFNSGLVANANPQAENLQTLAVSNVVVKRLRVNVKGRILTNTTVSVAGEQNCDCDSNSNANWPFDMVRFYAIDSINGDDTNIGYIDAPAMTVFTPSTLEAVALKTYEEFYDRLPKQGQYRRFLCLIRGDETVTTPIVYYKKDGVTVDVINVDGISGYAFASIRASDFTNSDNDNIDFAGYIPAALNGPGAGNVWTVSSFASPVITNASGVMPVDSSFCGAKVRWTGNITAAMRLQGTSAKGVLTASTLEVNSSSTTLPVANDTYTLRKPSIRFAGITGRCGGAFSPIVTTATTPISSAIQLIGFEIRSTVAKGYDSTNLALRFVNLTCDVSAGTISLTYRDGICDLNTLAKRENTNTSVSIRNAVTFDTPGVTEDTGCTINAEAAAASPSLGFSDVYTKCRLNLTGIKNRGGLGIMNGSAVYGPLVLDRCDVRLLGGSSASFRLMARGGSLNTRSCIALKDGTRVGLGEIVCGPNGGAGVEVTTGDSDGALLAPVTITGMINVTGTIAGGYGMTFVYSQIRGAVAALALIGTGNTVAGPSGDIRMNNFDLTWAQALAEERIDALGNHTMPTGGAAASIQRVATGSWLRVPETAVDPTETPPAGFVDVWFRSDTNQLSVKDSGATTLRVTLT